MSKAQIEVINFLDQLKHPFREEIDLLRSLISQAAPALEENIKWNGPNFSLSGEDRITMRILPPKKQVQLIFHRGAKKQETPPKRLIDGQFSFLTWKENDRAIATFKQRDEIENNKTDLTLIITKWLKATS